jgi:Na+-transporting NADH:ubiquinone oxidoreductase subunit D
MQNKPLPSLLDGIGNGLGYGMILILVSIGREILGNGSLFGLSLIPAGIYEAGYQNMGIMVLAPGAFILLGLIIWLQRSLFKYSEEE